MSRATRVEGLGFIGLIGLIIRPYRVYYRVNRACRV